MPEIIQGGWDELIGRSDLKGRTVRVTVLDDNREDPWLKLLQAWADSHQPLAQRIDDSRDSIYSGTLDDPR